MEGFRESEVLWFVLSRIPTEPPHTKKNKSSVVQLVARWSGSSSGTKSCWACPRTGSPWGPWGSSKCYGGPVDDSLPPATSWATIHGDAVNASSTGPIIPLLTFEKKSWPILYSIINGSRLLGHTSVNHYKKEKGPQLYRFKKYKLIWYSKLIYKMGHDF